MTDYCHLQLLCKLIAALKGLAKVLGPWPTVVLAGLVLAFAALCADHTFLIVQMIVKAVFAAFFYWFVSFKAPRGKEVWIRSSSLLKTAVPGFENLWNGGRAPLVIS